MSAKLLYPTLGLGGSGSKASPHGPLVTVRKLQGLARRKRRFTHGQVFGRLRPPGLTTAATATSG